MKARLQNLIKDYITQYLTKDEIIRVFKDNDVHVIPMMVKNTNVIRTYEVCCYELPFPKEKGDEKLLDIFNEVFSKVKKKNDTAIKAYHSNVSELNEKVENEFKANGYYFIDGKYTKSNIPIGEESLTQEIARLKKELLNRSQLPIPDIIGKSKEILEGIFKKICDSNELSYKKDETFPSLMTKALDSIMILDPSVTEYVNTLKFVKSLITNSSAKINEVRNIHGSGHAKSSSYVSIDRHSADFIANLSLSITEYLERINKF